MSCCYSRDRNKLTIMLMILLGIAGASDAQEKSLTFSTHWLPQAQFAGYYMAESQGFYREAGLNVKIINPPANVNAQTYLENGSADIVSLFLMSAVEARVNGTPIVNIAQMSEHSAILFVSMKNGPVQSLQDFQSKKIGVWKSGFEEVPKAMVRENGLNVQWVPILSSVNLFLLGGIELMTVMWYNEYHQIYLSGVDEVEMNTFFLSDYGFDIPEDGLYVLSSTYDEKKEELVAFVQASIKGWEYAASHFDETIHHVVSRMREAKVPANEAHQRWMLEKILKLQGFAGSTEKETILSKKDFQKAIDILNEAGGIQNVYGFQYDDFCRPLVTRKP